mgnify:FL=1
MASSNTSILNDYETENKVISIASASDDDIVEETFVSKETMRRIISDIKEIRKNPLTDHGIYYEHDETNMLCAKAMVIGPADTPYADGFYLFKIKYPANYPHSPPSVNFCTSDGVTRFNPNLYRTGKVCLSILNTWQGEQWSGCQTISSVLLAICTTLNNEPLLNEPGIKKSHSDFDSYNEIIKYKNMKVAIFDMLEQVKDPEHEHEFIVFADSMREHFLKMKENIRQRIETEIKERTSERIYKIGIYRMTIKTNYDALLIQCQ